jgi:predicted HicB family RNase H-like nuclease
MTKSGQVPQGDVRLTLNVREELHQKLKIASAMTRVTMGQLVEQLIADKLNDMLRAGIRPMP